METMITEILRTQFNSRSDAYRKEKKEPSTLVVDRSSKGDGHAYLRPYRELVNVPGEHGTAGEYAGVRRGHHRR